MTAVTPDCYIEVGDSAVSVGDNYRGNNELDAPATLRTPEDITALILALQRIRNEWAG